MSEQTNVQFVEKQSNGIGVAGFILALLAIFLGWVPVLGWVLWVLGLIFSAVGIAKAGKVKAGKGLSIAGLVISLVGLLFMLFVGAALAAAIGMS